VVEPEHSGAPQLQKVSLSEAAWGSDLAAVDVAVTIQWVQEHLTPTQSQPAVLVGYVCPWYHNIWRRVGGLGAHCGAVSLQVEEDEPSAEDVGVDAHQMWLVRVDNHLGPLTVYCHVMSR
jgi:hypothetical protein